MNTICDIYWFHFRVSSLVPLASTLWAAFSSCTAPSTRFHPLLRDSSASNFNHHIFHSWRSLTKYRINSFRIVGRLPIFLLAAAINLGVIVAMMVIVASQFFHSCWYHASWYQNCFALDWSNLWQIFPGFDFLFLFLTNCLHLGRTLGFGWCNMANPSCFSIMANLTKYIFDWCNRKNLDFCPSIMEASSFCLGQILYQQIISPDQCSIWVSIFWRGKGKPHLGSLDPPHILLCVW